MPTHSKVIALNRHTQTHIQTHTHMDMMKTLPLPDRYHVPKFLTQVQPLI